MKDDFNLSPWSHLVLAKYSDPKGCPTSYMAPLQEVAAILDGSPYYEARVPPPRPPTAKTLWIARELMTIKESNKKLERLKESVAASNAAQEAGLLVQAHCQGRIARFLNPTTFVRDPSWTDESTSRRWKLKSRSGSRSNSSRKRKKLLPKQLNFGLAISRCQSNPSMHQSF